SALEHWPREGIPDNPGAWLMTTARRKGIDRLRREKRYQEKLAELEEPSMSTPSAALPDERLELIFTCCHPALAREAQVALTRLHLARAEARFDPSGRMILLQDQDRAKWDRRRIDETFSVVGRFLTMRRPGPYQLQALIAGAHADAKSWEATRWPDILRSYDALLAINDSPVVRLNRAIALWHVRGAEQAYIELFPLAEELDRYHLYHATRGELLRALGRTDDARAADLR